MPPLFCTLEGRPTYRPLNLGMSGYRSISLVISLKSVDGPA